MNSPPPKAEDIRTNFFAEPTVLLVPITSRVYCIFDVQNLVLCLNRELIKIIDYKFMLKLQCKTTFNYVLLVKKSSKSNKSQLWNNVFKNCGFT